MLQVDLDDDGVHWLKEAQKEKIRQSRIDLREKIREKERQKWRDRGTQNVSGCGAGEQGSPGFHPGNVCAKGGGAGGRTSISDQEIKFSKLMNSGDHVNMVYRIELMDGTVGIYKPGTDDPEHIRDTIDPGRNTERELAASEIAEIIGMDDMVPPVVEMEFFDTKGCFREFVDGEAACDASNPWDGEKDLARAAAFDYLIGNSDRHLGQWYVKADGTLALIDHDLAFPNSHVEGLLNAGILDHVGDKAVPQEVIKWEKSWDKIQKVLKERGFTEKEIRATGDRLSALAVAAEVGDIFYGLEENGPTKWYGPGASF